MDIFLNKFNCDACTLPLEIKLSVGADADVSFADGNQADPVALDTVKDSAAFDTDGDLNAADTRGDSTGRDGMHHRYVVTITPKYENKNDIVVKVKSFYDQEREIERKYTPPETPAAYVEKTNKLTVKVGKEAPPAKAEGIIPKDGYLVVAKSAADSAVRNPGDNKKAPANPPRQPFGLTYNLIEGGLQNLESFLSNGGTIDLVAPQSLVISEIMWGSDASIGDSSKSQYIEIRNTSGAEIKMGDGTHKLVFYGAGATLPAVSTVKDRVGTVGAGGFWSLAGKGQSGRTGVDEAPGDQAAVTPTQALISMRRVFDATGVAADGTLSSSWAASTPPGLNFDLTKEGTRVGTPGRAPVAYPVAPTPEPEPEAEDIVITEIMVDMGNGLLPQ